MGAGHIRTQRQRGKGRGSLSRGPQGIRTGCTGGVGLLRSRCYYNLLTRDAQLEISEQTLGSWAESIAVREALKDAGRSNDIAVLQAKAKRLKLQASAETIRSNISIAENASRGAFHPSLTLSGALGWTDSGVKISDPAGWIWNALGSLTEPVFNHEANVTALKTAKARQEEAALLRIRQMGLLRTLPYQFRVGRITHLALIAGGIRAHSVQFLHVWKIFNF